VGDALVNGTLPPGLEGQYTADQFRLLCLAQDSDQAWEATPPARAALASLLQASGASLDVGWRVQRTAPPPSPHGGPLCDGVRRIPLAPLSRQHLLEVLNGTRKSAVLMAVNGSDPFGQMPGASGLKGLYGLMWRFSGDSCSVTPDIGRLAHGSDAAGWGQLYVTCEASLESSGARRGTQWWRLQCGIVNGDDLPVERKQAELNSCPDTTSGPRLVGILERVQAGLLGQTVSAFGITGLYITFVLSAGRFLRLAISNMRMRIPYDDLPNTSRLIALCQDIYIARAEGELALEEELYWAIINIYRRPSVLFELTKKKEA